MNSNFTGNIGFTGTQRGMTERQNATLRIILDVLQHKMLRDGRVAAILHHGDCIGADSQAHVLARLSRMQVYLHPPTIEAKRAYCRSTLEAIPLPYLMRNHAIVNACDVLIAAPGEREEQLRSGTWATIRYARKAGKSVVIVWP